MMPETSIGNVSLAMSCQHVTLPLYNRAHELYPDRAILATVVIPETSTGVALPPPRPYPQQFTLPSVSREHEWRVPAAMFVTTPSTLSESRARSKTLSKLWRGILQHKQQFKQQHFKQQHFQKYRRGSHQGLSRSSGGSSLGVNKRAENIHPPLFFVYNRLRRGIQDVAFLVTIFMRFLYILL